MGESQQYPQYSKVENGPSNKMIVLCVLIIVFILVCVSLDVSYQELGWLIFLEGIVGLTHLSFFLFWELFSFDCIFGCNSSASKFSTSC
jgi:hypothetical protein